MANSAAEAFMAEQQRAAATPQAEYEEPVKRQAKQGSPLGGLMKFHHKWTNTVPGKILAPGMNLWSDAVMKKVLKDKYSKVLGDNKNENLGLASGITGGVLGAIGGPGPAGISNELMANLTTKYGGF